MKYTASLLGVVAVLCLPMLAVAGDYHTGTTLICSDCHVMHYSQTHDYNPAGSGFVVPLGTAGPYHYLLRNDINDLCLSCHDGSAFAPDVLYTNTGSHVRQAGALNRAGAGLPETGHTLDATDVAPGSNPAWSDSTGLNCIGCHHQHGYHPSHQSAYRNLQHNPGNFGYNSVLVDYATGTLDLTKDVYQVATGPTNAVHYATSNISFNEPDPTKSEYAQFCKGCHTEFHGDKGGTELGGATGVEWLRHPTNDADIGAHTGGHSSQGVWSGHTNRVQTLSATGTYPAADNTPSCMSCHKAHGNQNAFGLIFMTGTGTVTEEGDGGTQAKDLCGQCHVQG